MIEVDSSSCNRAAFALLFEIGADVSCHCLFDDPALNGDGPMARVEALVESSSDERGDRLALLGRKRIQRQRRDRHEIRCGSTVFEWDIIDRLIELYFIELSIQRVGGGDKKVAGYGVRCSKASASSKKQKDCSFHDKFLQFHRRRTLLFRFVTVSAASTPAPASQRRATRNTAARAATSASTRKTSALHRVLQRADVCFLPVVGNRLFCWQHLPRHDVKQSQEAAT